MAGAPGLLTGGAKGGSDLPGLERIGWSGWKDLVGDWCGGVGLMIGGLLTVPFDFRGGAGCDVCAVGIAVVCNGMVVLAVVAVWLERTSACLVCISLALPAFFVQVVQSRRHALMQLTSSIGTTVETG